MRNISNPLARSRAIRAVVVQAPAARWRLRTQTCHDKTVSGSEVQRANRRNLYLLRREDRPER
jgi:hypothetical protein